MVSGCTEEQVHILPWASDSFTALIPPGQPPPGEGEGGDADQAPLWLDERLQQVT